MKQKRKITTLLFALCLSLAAGFAQEVRGVVTDSDGEPLIGVSVVEKGTSNGTITDLNGAFVLQLQSANAEKAKLHFSYVGYQSVELSADSKRLAKVEMMADNKLLDEVVVVGYGQKRKGGIASAVTTVQAEDIVRSTSTTTSGALVGKVAGITSRQSSGVPGAAASIQVRNLGTPLYVIDGVIKDESAFNNLDISDIENVSVLKDGAAAIYGVKAANGVVLVTTKKGKANQKMEVNLNAYMGWQQWTEYPELLSAYDWVYANYMRDVNSGTLAVTTEQARAELEKWKSGYYNPETGEDYRGYDWYHNYVRSAAPQYYANANLSGGSEKVTYYASLSHVGQEAVFQDYTFNRTNLQTNVDVNITDNLKFGTQISGKIDNTINPGLPGSDDYEARKLSVIGMLPIYRPYANDNEQYVNYIAGYDGAHNPASYTIDNAGEYHKRNTTFQTNFTLDWQTPLQGLSARALFSYFYNGQDINNLEKAWQEYTYDPINKTYNVAYAKTDTWMERTRATTNDLTGQALVSYDNTFSGHHVSATVGFEFYQRKYNSIYNSQNPVDNPYIDLITTSENNKVTEVLTTQTTASVIFRAGYDYKQRYIIDFAGRYDGSWKFAKGKRWGFFPSVSGAWRMSEEVWWQDGRINDYWSNFKIRVSYGQMGDDNVGALYPDFAYLDGYTYNSGKYFTTVDPLLGNTNSALIGAIYRGTPNTQISWMTTSLTDVGIDLGFFNNRLTAEFDFFLRHRSGIAAQPDDLVFPLESGLSPLAQNLNSDKHIGGDGFIKWQDKVGNFRYSIGGNITIARQRNGVRAGEKFYNAWDKYRNSKSDRWSNVENNQVWQWETIGVFQTQEEIDNYPVIIDGANNTTLQPGDLIFKDVNGDGVIDEYDKRPLGYSSIMYAWNDASGIKQPILSFGLNFGLEWRGIDFAMDFAGASMNTYVPDWYMKWACSREMAGYASTALNSWHHEDILDPTSPWVAGKFPAVSAKHPSARGENDFYTRNVNYIRLRNLVLGYTFPKRWTEKAKIRKARIYFEGTNLFCFDSLEDYGVDPEIAYANGIDYPQSRVFTIGFNLGF